MARHLLAVLVRVTATPHSVDMHLAKPMRALERAGVIDSWRFGGGVTGAWNADYDPEADPANWRACPHCDGATPACPACSDAMKRGRLPGTVLEPLTDRWMPHAGDIVPLTQLMDPGWRFPPGRLPDAWVDLAGIVWLGTQNENLTATAAHLMPWRLREVLDDLIGLRRPLVPSDRRRNAERFTIDGFAAAVVDAHS